MLLSLRELTMWTGAGPFEASLHSFGLLLSTILAVLQVEGAIATSWHVVMVPLYVALGTVVYFDVVLYSRMAIGMWKRSRVAWLLIVGVGVAGAGLTLFAEIALADYLNGGASSTLVVAVVMLLGYLLVRGAFVFRALLNEPDDND